VVKDSQILVAARNTAISLLQDDSNLSKPENANINRAYSILSKNSKIWSNIS
jgi:ATP-dependent DNA helicase RecG